MKRTFLVALTGLALLACGQQPAAAPSNPVSYHLYLRDYQSISVADAASGRVLSSLPAGVHTPDWSRVYAVSGSNSQTLLALDAASGQRLAEMPLPGPYQIPFQSTPLAIVSPNGRWISLGRWDTAPGAPSVALSHFAVVDGTQKSPTKQLDLRGYWNVDALSNDGRWLYLIENLPANAQYRVRLYDLATGALNPTAVVDPHDGDAPMTGQRVDSVASPDGGWIYSLYSSSTGAAFIHALPVGSGSTSAVCIDLPDLKNRDAMTLTMSADGSRLFVTDGLANLVQEIVPPGAGATGEIARSLHLPAVRAGSSSLFGPLFVNAEASGPGDGPGAGMHSVLTRDGVLYFPTTSGMAAVDVKGWKVRGRYLGDQYLRTLILSSDGRWLYGVTQSQHLIRVDPGTGQRVQELQSGPWSLQLERAAQVP